MFEVLDKMNLDDTANGTQLVKISNAFVSGDKIKQGAKIAMGVDEQCLLDIMSQKYIPLLVVVNSDEYFKRKK